MKKQIGIALVATLVGVTLCAIAQEPGQKPAVTESTPVKKDADARLNTAMNVFTVRTNGDVVAMIEGKPDVDCYTLKCDDDLWKKVLDVAASAGVLQADRKTAVIQKDLAKIEEKKKSGIFMPGQAVINGNFGPRPSRGTANPHSIVRFLWDVGEMADIYFINNNNDAAQVVFNESDKALNVSLTTGALIFIAHIDGACKVWQLQSK